MFIPRPWGHRRVPQGLSANRPEEYNFSVLEPRSVADWRCLAEFRHTIAPADSACTRLRPHSSGSRPWSRPKFSVERQPHTASGKQYLRLGHFWGL